MFPENFHKPPSVCIYVPTESLPVFSCLSILKKETDICLSKPTIFFSVLDTLNKT